MARKLNVTKLLLERGADVNSAPNWNGGRTALQAAAMAGDHGGMKLLLGGGTDISAPSSECVGRAALRAAVEDSGDPGLGTVKFLLERGTDINAGPGKYHGKTALQAVAGNEYFGEIELELLLERGG